MSVCISLRSLLGAIAYWGVAQQEWLSKGLPRNYDTVLDKVREQILVDFDLDCGGSFVYKEFSDWEKAGDYIYNLLMGIPEFVDWNLSDVEIKAGVKVGDTNRDKFQFSSRYEYVKQEHSFIDLDAFVRNVFHSLKERVCLLN